MAGHADKEIRNFSQGVAKEVVERLLNEESGKTSVRDIVSWADKLTGVPLWRVDSSTSRDHRDAVEELKTAFNQVTTTSASEYVRIVRDTPLPDDDFDRVLRHRGEPARRGGRDDDADDDEALPVSAMEFLLFDGKIFFMGAYDDQGTPRGEPIICADLAELKPAFTS